MRDYLAFLSARRLSIIDRDLLSTFLGAERAHTEDSLSTTASEGPLLTESEEGEEEEEDDSESDGGVRLEEHNPAAHAEREQVSCCLPLHNRYSLTPQPLLSNTITVTL